MRAIYSPFESASIAINEIREEIGNGVLPTVAIGKVAARHDIDKRKLVDLYFGTKSAA